MAENSKSIVDRKENKDILQKVRPNISLVATAKMLKMWYFGHINPWKKVKCWESLQVQKKSLMRWMDDTKSWNWTPIKWPKSVTERQEKLVHISVQHNQKEKKDKCWIQDKGNDKPLLWECCLVHPQGSPGVLQTRRTSSSSNEYNRRKDPCEKFNNRTLKWSNNGTSYNYKNNDN